jgi:hypothetical protein
VGSAIVDVRFRAGRIDAVWEENRMTVVPWSSKRTGIRYMRSTTQQAGFRLGDGSAKKILTEDAPTKDGRCPRCPAGASSSGRVKSPRTLFQAALAAEKLGGGR